VAPCGTIQSQSRWSCCSGAARAAKPTASTLAATPGATAAAGDAARSATTTLRYLLGLSHRRRSNAECEHKRCDRNRTARRQACDEG
jgi:hypothetical protein